MVTIVSVLAWIQANPGTVVAALTWLQAVCQTIGTENGWRWAVVTAKVLASLPAVNVAGIAAAFKKSTLVK